MRKGHPKECDGDFHDGQNGTWKCWKCGMIGGGFNDVPQLHKLTAEQQKKKEMIEFLKNILPYWESDDLDDYKQQYKTHKLTFKQLNMGHHINKTGQFISDKYLNLGANKLVLSFKDKEARIALRVYAEITPDKELGEDILTVLNNF